MKEKIRLTSLERYWVFYDIGNSAFILLAATLIPIFFNSLANGSGLNKLIQSPIYIITNK